MTDRHMILSVFNVDAPLPDTSTLSGHTSPCPVCGGLGYVTDEPVPGRVVKEMCDACDATGTVLMSIEGEIGYNEGKSDATATLERPVA